MFKVEMERNVFSGEELSRVEFVSLNITKIALEKYSFVAEIDRLNKAVHFEDSCGFGMKGSIRVSGYNCKLSCPSYVEHEFEFGDSMHQVIEEKLHIPMMIAMDGFSKGVMFILSKDINFDTSARYHIIADYEPGIDVLITRDQISINRNTSELIASLRFDSFDTYNFKTLINCYLWVKLTVGLLND